MKSFGTYNPPELVGLEFIRLAVPSGRQLPRAPVPGELCNLEVDMPEPTTLVPWYSKGTYAFDGYKWNKLSDGSRMRRADIIAAREIEVERAGTTANIPVFSHGYQLAAVMLTPSNRKAAISGSASFWTDVQTSGYIWCSVFRGSKLVGLVVEWVDAGKPRTIGLTFLDLPGSIDQQIYTLKIDTDAVGSIYINQCAKFGFDGTSQTAFIVAENI